MLSYPLLVLSNFFSSKQHRMMLSKQYDTLHAPHLTWDTETFLTLASSVVLQSKDPVKALLKDAAVVAIHYPNKEEHNFILNKLVE
jgi:hypothetical protein